MANKGNSRHLRRLAKSPALPIEPKKAIFLIKPGAGSHKASECIPLLVLLREMLGNAATSKEAKRVLSQGLILVDGKPRKDLNYGVGLLDIISVPKTGKNYQIFAIKGKLRFVEVDNDDAKLKSCRIVSKTTIVGNKVQLNLHDGKNIIIEKEEDRFRVGDTVRIKIPGYQVESFLKLEKGARCYIYKGKHSGKLGTLEEIIEQPGGQPSDAKLRVDEQDIITRKDYLFAVSKEFHL